ncbi:hypothetical protein, partial [Suttonella ornithocola]|uniref:hypothetical protein n=1 Tax=Suttonella ornithocola TaxID=279832 RepID=UPI001B800998
YPSAHLKQHPKQPLQVIPYSRKKSCIHSLSSVDYRFSHTDTSIHNDVSLFIITTPVYSIFILEKAKTNE